MRCTIRLVIPKFIKKKKKWNGKSEIKVVDGSKNKKKVQKHHLCSTGNLTVCS